MRFLGVAISSLSLHSPDISNVSEYTHEIPVFFHGCEALHHAESDIFSVASGKAQKQCELPQFMALMVAGGPTARNQRPKLFDKVMKKLRHGRGKEAKGYGIVCLQQENSSFALSLVAAKRVDC